MKILFLAPASSAHTIKWCTYFTGKGHEVFLITFTPGQIRDVQVHFIDTGAESDAGDLKKLKYLSAIAAVKRTVKQIAPDVVSVHYASSYGLIAALAGLKGYSLSVWGSDIFEFPKKSILHKMLLKYSLAKAGYLFSTSAAMAEEAKQYTDRDFSITPFGVDLNLFSPEKRTRPAQDGQFVVGTVKGLHPNYGISDLLKGVGEFCRSNPEAHVQVRIAGNGPEEESLKKLTNELGLDNTVSWLGFISQERAAAEWVNMDAAVIPSIHESFGVSSLEAQASGCALIISDVPGLMETAIPGATAIVVGKRQPTLIAQALSELYNCPERRSAMGQRGRSFVAEKYEINACFERIEALFFKMASEKEEHSGK